MSLLRFAKIGKDLQKYVKPIASNCGPWPQNMVVSLDRTLGEITRILDKQVYRCFAAMTGTHVVRFRNEQKRMVPTYFVNILWSSFVVLNVF